MPQDRDDPQRAPDPERTQDLPVDVPPSTPPVAFDPAGNTLITPHAATGRQPGPVDPAGETLIGGDPATGRHTGPLDPNAPTLLTAGPGADSSPPTAAPGAFDATARTLITDSSPPTAGPSAGEPFDASARTLITDSTAPSAGPAPLPVPPPTSPPPRPQQTDVSPHDKTQLDTRLDTVEYGDDSEPANSALDASLVSRTPSGRLMRAGAAPTQVGHYRVVRELGRGGMGVVYEAVNLRTERKVALKVLLVGEGADEQDVARFQVEARAGGRLKHPNLVQVLEMDQDAQGNWYLAMDLVEGESLLAKVKREGPVEDRRAAELILQLARGVAHAHQHDILHRDIKPHNVLLDETQAGKPLLTDFGLAKLTGAQATQLTKVGLNIMGTPGFMPPEQAGTGAGPDERSDVYGLGATLYFMLTGEPVFSGKLAANILYALVHQAARAPSRLQPGIHPDLETICLKCLEKKKDHRYASAAELADDLERFLASQKIEAKRPSLPVQLWRWGERNKPKAAALLAVCGAVLVAAGFGVDSYLRRAEIEREAREERAKIASLSSEVKAETAKVETEKAELQREREAAEAKRRATPPKLTLLKPIETDQGRVKVRSIGVLVRVEDDDVAQVTLDGKPLQRGEAGRWSGSWSLAEGANEGLVVATDEAGNTSQLPALKAVRDTTAPQPKVAWKAAGSDAESPKQTEAERVTLVVVPDEPIVSANLRVNGKAVAAPKGPWGPGEPVSIDVALPMGKAKLELVVADGLGNERGQELVVERQFPKLLRGFPPTWTIHPDQRAYVLKTKAPLWVTNSLGMRFVLVPPGEFAMGSPKGEQGKDGEFQHQVKLTRGFYMAELEVSNALLAKVGLRPRKTTVTGKFVYGPRAGEAWTRDLGRPELPAVFVSWTQAVAFCDALNQLERAPGRYRLPTEAEWEYACRAGARTRWPWGDEPEGAVKCANIADGHTNLFLNLGHPKNDAGTLFFDLVDGDGQPFTAPVASPARPNAFGLRHMIGNAAEWCRDHYRGIYYGAAPHATRVDPQGPPAPQGKVRPRVVRGGGWASGPHKARSAARLGWPEDRSTRDIGFRVVRVVGERD